MNGGKIDSQREKMEERSRSSEWMQEKEKRNEGKIERRNGRKIDSHRESMEERF